MRPARFAIAVATSAAGKATGANPKTCNVFQARLQIFDPAAASPPASLDLREITDQPVFDVINVHPKAIEIGDEVYAIQTADERWVALCPCNG